MVAVGELTSCTPDETQALGQKLGSVLGPGHVVGLTGELGAGKTCFVQGAARGLEVDPAVYVSSPTFTLVNEYPGRLPVAHIDLYRLSDADELVEIGLDDYYRGQGVCLVEWFDRFVDEVPPDYLSVELSVEGETRRRLVVNAVGCDHVQLGQRWLRACSE